MKNRWRSLLLGVVVSAIILIYLLQSNLGQVRAELSRTHYEFILAYALLFLFGQWIRARRWLGLLHHQLSSKHSFHILNIGYGINGTLPLRIGELARAVLAARVDPPVQPLTVLATVVVERMLDTLALVALMGLTLVLLPIGLEIELVGIGLSLGSLSGLILLASFARRPLLAHRLIDLIVGLLPPLKRLNLYHWLDSLLEGVASLRSLRDTMWAVGWTVLAWTITVISTYLFLYSLYSNPAVSAAVALTCLTAFTAAVPAIPGNLGPFEGAVVFALVQSHLASGANDPRAMAFAILLHTVVLFLYISMSIWGLWAVNGGVSVLPKVIRLSRTSRPKEMTSLEPR